jgi:hypothetical protein
MRSAHMTKPIREGEFMETENGAQKAIIVTDHLASYFDDENRPQDIVIEKVKIAEGSIVQRILDKYQRATFIW